MGCAFCASAATGLARNLEPHEIVEQVLHLSSESEAARIRNIVVMGTGEPLMNLENLLCALEILHADWGLGIGWRRVTISTVGIPDRIETLAKRQIPFSLAVSLHAADDALRSELVPANRKWPLRDTLRAADLFAQSVRREYTVEYVMLKGVNVSESHAKGLAKLLQGRHCLVNLIRFNSFPESPFAPAAPDCIQVFRKVLERNGIRATIRRSAGGELHAACGQLRAQISGKTASVSCL